MVSSHKMTPYITANVKRSKQSALEELSHANGLIESSHDLSDTSGAAVPRHPLGVRPSGNSYAAESDDRHAIGLFSILPDELILQLLDYFCADSLLRFGATCKALYAFSRTEDLWKALFIEYGSFSHWNFFP